MRLSLAAAITGLAALVSSVTAAENTTSLPDCLSVPVNVTWTRPYQGEKCESICRPHSPNP
jgi:hypothetical protein